MEACHKASDGHARGGDGVHHQQSRPDAQPCGDQRCTGTEALSRPCTVALPKQP